ncbi:MAG: MarR family transcriptional regulator, partial [Aeromicrobium erythreum]
MVLWEDDDITVSSLGARLRLDSGTLSPLLKRLQVRGLVDRRPSADDARVVHVRLTDEGRTLADEADRISACVRDTVALSDDEIGLLRSL